VCIYINTREDLPQATTGYLKMYCTSYPMMLKVSHFMALGCVPIAIITVFISCSYRNKYCVNIVFLSGGRAFHNFHDCLDYFNDIQFIYFCYYYDIIYYITIINLESKKKIEMKRCRGCRVSP
jgi:hypothetical protein